MGTIIKGMKKLDSNCFEQVNISEDVEKNEYLVRVYGGNAYKNSILVGKKFSDKIKGMGSEERVIEVIQRYLENFRINCVTSLLGSAHRKGKWIYIHGNNGSNILRLQLFNLKFDEIFKIINNKYLNDRYDFFWNKDIKKMKLSLDSKKSAYNVYPIECEECERDIICSEDKDANPTCETYVQYSVRYGKDGNVLDYERKFLEEFLYHKFWQCGEEATVKSVCQEFPNSLNRKFIGHTIKCGDFELYFPHSYVFMFIFEIVNDYNHKLFVIKNEEKKKQLKMEEF